MSLLTEQEIFECLPDNGDSLAFARSIEAKVIEKIKAQGPAATITRNGFPHHVSYIYGDTELKLYGPSEPLYRLPEGD